MEISRQLQDSNGLEMTLELIEDELKKIKTGS
jgi:hypothetical protein